MFPWERECRGACVWHWNCVVFASYSKLWIWWTWRTATFLRNRNWGPRFRTKDTVLYSLDMNVTERMVGTFREKSALEPSRARILIVEDESFVAVDDQLTLEGVGFETIGVVATAEEAIEVAERERPDLVLMDVHLAGPLNGIDAAVRIFERCAIHSVFATAHVDDQTKELADRAQPVGWLTKPFNSNDLVRAVELGLEKTKQ